MTGIAHIHLSVYELIFVLIALFILLYKVHKHLGQNICSLKSFLYQGVVIFNLRANLI